MLKLKKTISRLLYPLGLQIDLRKIRYGNFEEIKQSALLFKSNNDIKSYSGFINKITGKSFRRIRFIGLGGAQNTTQTHAVVKNNSQLYFEKVYNRHSRDFLFLKKYYNKYYLLLSEHNIQIPELVTIYEKGKVALCHFGYFESLQPFGNWAENTFNILQKFNRIPYEKLEPSLKYTELTLIRNALEHLFFHAESDSKTLKKIIDIKYFIEKQSYVFTHGDFYVKNIFKNILLDWDDMGFYPYGIDMAFLIHNDRFFDHKNRSLNETLAYLNNLGHLTENEKTGVAFFALLIETYLENLQGDTVTEWINDLYQRCS